MMCLSPLSCKIIEIIQDRTKSPTFFGNATELWRNVTLLQEHLGYTIRRHSTIGCNLESKLRDKTVNRFPEKLMFPDASKCFHALETWDSLLFLVVFGTTLSIGSADTCLKDVANANSENP